MVLPVQILEVFHDYYSKLYSSTKPKIEDINSFLSDNKFNIHLSSIHASALETPLSEEEIRLAIQKLKLNKSPGLDGFTSNYYKKYSSLLLSPMSALFNDVFATGILPPSWNQARLIMMIIIIRKVTMHWIQNLIAPSQSWTKIIIFFASVWSSRLNHIIGDYILDDQTGFIPGRDIGDNIRKMVNLIQYASRSSSTQSCLLSLDITKASDSVEKSYLISVLKLMGFGPPFCNIIQSIYSSPLSPLHINGLMSSPIQLSRGTQQGCPFFSLL